MKIIPAFLFIFIVFADQLIKFFVSKAISAQSIFILPEILKLKIHQNTGIAFGISFNPWLAYLLIIFLAILIFIVQKRKQDVYHFYFAPYSLILIFSGALSNLLDRARFGYVIDYVEFIPLRGFFNLADCAIVIGIIMIILKILNQNNVNQKRRGENC